MTTKKVAKKVRVKYENLENGVYVVGFEVKGHGGAKRIRAVDIKFNDFVSEEIPRNVANKMIKELGDDLAQIVKEEESNEE